LKLIILGPPGAGKGTQAALLSARLGIPTLSTGNILRAAINEGRPVGLKAKEYMDAGKLVPDDIIISVVKEVLSDEKYKDGYILDGIPRTQIQAEMLENMNVGIDAVLFLDISDSRVQKRISSRRVCLHCGATYSLSSFPPKKEGLCDVCGSDVVNRDDDKPEAVKERLIVYHAQTAPIIDYYRSRGKLVAIDGMSDVEDTTKAILKALENL